MKFVPGLWSALEFNYQSSTVVTNALVLLTKKPGGSFMQLVYFTVSYLFISN
jgi:hypothetical protein